MKVKAILGIGILLLIPLIFLISCSQQQAEWKGTIEDVDGVTVVKNPESPKYSGKDAPQLVYEKDLTIPLSGKMYSIDVNQDGIMYALDIIAGEVEVYDINGRFLKKFGKKGQGPGEFTRPWYLSISAENEIFILDKSTRIIHVFDSQGSVLKHMNYPSSLGLMNSFVFDSEKNLNIYYTLSTFRLNDKEKLNQGIIGVNYLSKFNKSLEKLLDIFTCNYEFSRRSTSGESKGVVYNNIFYYQIDQAGNLYYGYSDKYEIFVLSPDGQLKKTIKKEAPLIKPSEKDMEYVLKEYPGLQEFKDTLIISDTKPCFSAFYLLEGIGMLVSTYENEWNEEGIISCDLFNQEGVYIAKVVSPKYYYWNHHELISEQRNRIFKNGYCYSIIYNKETDFLELVRQRVKLIFP